MSLRPGMRIWLPCEVKPGPFSDERMVRLGASGEEWLGFVDVHSLRDAVTEGSTYVRALVVEVRDDDFVARLPGYSVSSDLFRGSISKVAQVGSLEA